MNLGPLAVRRTLHNMYVWPQLPSLSHRHSLLVNPHCVHDGIFKDTAPNIVSLTFLIDTVSFKSSAFAVDNDNRAFTNVKREACPSH